MNYELSIINYQLSITITNYQQFNKIDYNYNEIDYYFYDIIIILKNTSYHKLCINYDMIIILKIFSYTYVI